MKAIINLDMDRIFRETEAAVQERAANIIVETRAQREDPQLGRRLQADRELEAQRIVDSVPALIAEKIAKGEQSLILMTVERGSIWGYNYCAARVIEEFAVDHNTAVAEIVIEKLTGIDKLHVRRTDYQQPGTHGGFFVRLNW